MISSGRENSRKNFRSFRELRLWDLSPMGLTRSSAPSNGMPSREGGRRTGGGESLTPCQLFHSCSRKREANGGKKFLIVEGLAEKCRRPRVQSCRSNQWIILSSKDNDASRRRNFAKPRLHVQTVHQRHPDIYHRDGSPMSFDVKEELRGIAELFGVPTSRREQPAQAF